MCTRQTFCRSFATTARRLQENKTEWATPLTAILKEAEKVSVPKQQVKRTKNLHFRLFHADQLLSERALSYEACTKTRPILKKSAVAPPPAVARSKDIFHQLNLDPRDFTTNPPVLSNFVTEMGKIQGRDQTMLTLKNHRLLGRTIRRAKMMGVIPNLSRF